MKRTWRNFIQIFTYHSGLKQNGSINVYSEGIVEIFAAHVDESETEILQQVFKRLLVATGED